jgi:large subunit ribosomal protein L32e
MATDKKTAAEAKGKKKEAEKPVPKVEKKAVEAQKHVKKEEHSKEHAAKAEHTKAEHAEHTKHPAHKEHEHKEHADKEPEHVKEKKDVAPKSAEKESSKKPVKKTSEKDKAEKDKKPEKKKKEKKIKLVEKIEFLGDKALSKDEEALLSKKKGKPRFIRQEFHKLPRLKEVWRKSRGIDSKKHEGKRGKGETPQDGYKNTEEIRGITPQGFFPCVVRNLADLDKIDTKKQAAVIGATVGRKSRNEIIKAANGKKITILNPRKGERGKK